jgi:predicted HicB family RNase H-like nuclease
MEKAAERETVKTSIRLPKELWREVRLAAVQQDLDLQDLVVEALRAYLKNPVRARRPGK